jgi:uncharacterized protein
MFDRQALHKLRERLSWNPGVVLLGPRQVGKTSLARVLAAGYPDAVLLDLEKPADRAQLAEPELFLAQHRSRLVVLDEVQFMPQLFSALRPEIDAHRRPGRFVLLGSASGALLRQSAESLAGRVSYLELPPFLAREVLGETSSGTHGLEQLQTLWQRGGFPLSYTASSDTQSFAWRQDFIQTFLQRDLPQLGVRTPAETLHRFWRMLAHLQGQMFNASALGQSLGGLSHTTVARYLDTLVDTMVVRRLEPQLANVGKRLVKSPKVYVRDSGLVHALLGIENVSELQGHPIVGASWEGFVIEQILAHAPTGATCGFYRTVAGAEIDLVLLHGKRRIGFEVKFSSAPKVSKGFWEAQKDLQLSETYVVAPVQRRYPLAAHAEVVPVGAVPEICQR